MLWVGVIVAPFVTYIVVYLATGFMVVELTEHVPVLDWVVEFVANPVLCGLLAVIVPTSIAPSHQTPVAVYGLVVLTTAVLIPDAADFLFAQSGLVAPVIATIAGGVIGVAVAITDRTMKAGKRSGRDGKSTATRQDR